MTIFKMFSIYDEKARAHLPPFILPEEGMAIRTFADCVNDGDHQFGKHPHDYTLIKIADFDDEHGQITPDRQTVGNGIEYKTQQGHLDEPQQTEQ